MRASAPKMAATLTSLTDAGQHPDDDDVAADADGLDRLLEGAGAADLDHVVDAATAVEPPGRLGPFRLGR